MASRTVYDEPYPSGFKLGFGFGHVVKHLRVLCLRHWEVQDPDEVRYSDEIQTKVREELRTVPSTTGSQNMRWYLVRALLSPLAWSKASASTV